MSSVRNPIGPQPPSVYWRRRVFVLLGLVAIIVVIVLIVTSYPTEWESGWRHRPTGAT